MGSELLVQELHSPGPEGAEEESLPVRVLHGAVRRNAANQGK